MTWFPLRSRFEPTASHVEPVHETPRRFPLADSGGGTGCVVHVAAPATYTSASIHTRTIPAIRTLLIIATAPPYCFVYAPLPRAPTSLPCRFSVLCSPGLSHDNRRVRARVAADHAQPAAVKRPRPVVRRTAVVVGLRLADEHAAGPWIACDPAAVPAALQREARLVARRRASSCTRNASPRLVLPAPLPTGAPFEQPSTAAITGTVEGGRDIAARAVGQRLASTSWTVTPGRLATITTRPCRGGVHTPWGRCP